MGIVAENGNSVEQNTKLRINWLNVNVPTIVSIIGLAVGGVTWANRVETSQTELNVKWAELEKYRTQRGAQTDRRFDMIEQKLRPLDAATYQLNQHDAQIAVLNQRFDRLAEVLGETLDSVKTTLGSINTKVEVLDQKVTALQRGSSAR